MLVFSLFVLVCVCVCVFVLVSDSIHTKYQHKQEQKRTHQHQHKPKYKQAEAETRQTSPNTHNTTQHTTTQHNTTQHNTHTHTHKDPRARTSMQRPREMQQTSFDPGPRGNGPKGGEDLVEVNILAAQSSWINGSYMGHHGAKSCSWRRFSRILWGLPRASDCRKSTGVFDGRPASQNRSGPWL